MASELVVHVRKRPENIKGPLRKRKHRRSQHNTINFTLLQIKYISNDQVKCKVTNDNKRKFFNREENKNTLNINKKEKIKYGGRR